MSNNKLNVEEQAKNFTGWFPISDTWTRTGTHQFTVSTADPFALNIYRKWAKVRYKDGGAFDEYGVIGNISASFSGGVYSLTVDLIPNSDYSMAAATITDKYVACLDIPVSFPSSFNFATVLTNVTLGTGGVSSFKWSARGAGIDWLWSMTLGTSPAVSGLVRFSLPLAPITYPGANVMPMGIARLLDANGSTYSGIALLVGSVPAGQIQTLDTSGTYAVATNLSSTIPFTWAVSDEIDAQGFYFA